MHIALTEERDAGGRRAVWAKSSEDGTLAISGQDIGPGVENIFGTREYEWEIRIAAKDVASAADALEALPGETALDALQRAWAGTRAHRIHARLMERGVNFTFWNRIGD